MVSEKNLHDVHTINSSSHSALEKNYPAPDGLRAFVVLFFCVLINVATTGIANSFPVYQTYYLEKFGEGSASSIGWIGTLLLAAMLFFSIITAPLIAWIGFKKVTFIGGLIGGGALVIASFCSQIYQLALTNGLLFGFGTAFPFLCAVSMVSIWFDKYRGLGMGLINGGGGIGGIILTPIIQKLIDSYSIQTSLRAMGGFVFVAIAISSFFMKRRTPVSEKQVVFDKKATYDPFVFLVSISTLFGDIAYTIPLYYLPTLILDRGGSKSLSTTSVVLSNVGSITGSIFMGVMADRIGEMNIITIADFLVVILVPALWLGTSSPGALAGLSFVYGFLSAAFLSIVPSILGRHYPDHRVPGVISVMFVYVAVGLVIGGPLAGFVYDKSVAMGTYVPIVLMCALGYLVSGILLIVAQIYLRMKNRGKQPNTPIPKARAIGATLAASSGVSSDDIVSHAFWSNYSMFDSYYRLSRDSTSNLTESILPLE
ncbi:hypothetical protein BB561_005354 [Smittium simulii]|uniref:Major facilitator superfamily (MFS) profile domain-containing protein n=1 Tax=Smittium simulii TaxID=133385 RepID=A0A2T9YAT6_9FUNG|nr:hypothetical protein BB561_005354 [Smittium simulii]